MREKGNGVRSATLWARLLGVEQAVVERVAFDEDAEAIVVAVPPRRGTKRRCGKCGRRCPGFDRGEGRRRWRALDLGTIRAYLEAEAPRVCCPEHGAVGVAVPWARPGAGATHASRGRDESAYKRGHRYLTVVVDHDTRRLVWAAPGHDTTTLGRFFDALGPQR